MPITTLSPHKYRKILYEASKHGLGIRVNADGRINIHTVPASQLENWRSDDTKFRGSSFRRTKRLNIQSNSGPEFEEDWYLILENTSDETIEVEYEVSEG